METCGPDRTERQRRPEVEEDGRLKVAGPEQPQVGGLEVDVMQPRMRLHVDQAQQHSLGDGAQAALRQLFAALQHLVQRAAQ